MITRKKSNDVSINLTPLIDIVFLLLIFFMVSTTFTRETQIKLELPKASVDKMENDPQVIEISVDQQGRLFVNGKGLVNSQVETLVKAISPLINQNKELPVIISADKNTPYQSVITAMDAASQLGITNIKMATQKADD